MILSQEKLTIDTSDKLTTLEIAEMLGIKHYKVLEKNKRYKR